MIIVTVDNQSDRLAELAACLQDAFPGSEVVDFIQPGLAVQYSFQSHVDLVFAERFMRRLDGFQVAEGIRFFQPEAMIYLVSDARSTLRNTSHKGIMGSFVRPLSAEEIRLRVEKDRKVWERIWQTKHTSAVSYPGTGGDIL